MSVTWYTAVGLAAALLTSTSFVPQLVARLRNPRSARLAWGTLAAFSAGVSLWIVYGVYRRDWIIIGANVFILINLLLLAGVQAWQERRTPAWDDDAGRPAGSE